MYSAEYIVEAFDKAGIMRVNSVAFEKNGLYNRVYIGIAYWYDTETAYNFIARLQNPCIETRFGHNDEYELWWAIHINKYHNKIAIPTKKRSLVLFNLNYDQELISNESDEFETEFPIELHGLERQSAWDEMDLYLCPALLAEPLTFETQNSYYDFLEQKYDWVDVKLEEIYKNMSLKYELCVMKNYRPAFC